MSIDPIRVAGIPLLFGYPPNSLPLAHSHTEAGWMRAVPGCDRAGPMQSLAARSIARRWSPVRVAAAATAAALSALRIIGHIAGKAERTFISKLNSWKRKGKGGQTASRAPPCASPGVRAPMRGHSAPLKLYACVKKRGNDLRLQIVYCIVFSSIEAFL